MPEQPTLWDDEGPAGTAGDPRVLPDYELRVHPRARRILIRVRPGRPIAVTVPRGTPRHHAEEALREHAEWVARATARVARQAADLEARRAAPVGDVVELVAAGRAWRIERGHSESAGVRARERGDTIVLTGAVGDPEAVTDALRRWVRRAAERELTILAAEVAEATGARPKSVTVAWPRTRWGSCAPDGRVRLSVDLVFLPRELAAYVVAHEYAHLSVLDHSERFYRHLASLDADWERHRAALRRGRDHIPGWALRD